MLVAWDLNIGLLGAVKPRRPRIYLYIIFNKETAHMGIYYLCRRLALSSFELLRECSALLKFHVWWKKDWTKRIGIPNEAKTDLL